jgi:hypothetical protein
MKRLLILPLVVLSLLTLGGCAGWENSLTKTTTGWVGDQLRVVFFSGGTPVREYHINGTVNEDSESTWYFNCLGHLVKVDGDVLVEPRAIREKNYVDVQEVTVCN